MGTRKQKRTHVEDDDNDSDEALSLEDQVRVHGGKHKSSVDMAESRKRRHLGGDKEVGKDGTTKAKSGASKIASEKAQKNGTEDTGKGRMTKAKSGTKGKGKVPSKAKVNELEEVDAAKSWGSIARKAKAKVVSIPDGIEDDKEGESDEYVDD